MRMHVPALASAVLLAGCCFSASDRDYPGTCILEEVYARETIVDDYVCFQKVQE